MSEPSAALKAQSNGAASLEVDDSCKDILNLEIQHLRRAYADGQLTPPDVIEGIQDRLKAQDGDGVWISVVPREEMLKRARELEAMDPSDRERYPLFGLPFSVKDCIDVAGLPTTAGCPDFAYIPEKTNLAVARALDAGAILIGKTNLDQFATGLVGIRTPYGVAKNPFNSNLIPGGSSSGAAVSVATGLVSFAFGTDTGGSGRIPAGFNNIVGLKPTLGILSRTCMTNACRTLDTVSIFALTAPDALEVLNVCTDKDPSDSYGRTPPKTKLPAYSDHVPFTFAVPREEHRQFFGNKNAAALYRDALHELQQIGGQEVEIDYSPFLAVNDFLFNGPWLAERLASIGSFIYEKPDALHPAIREIILGAEKYTATDFIGAMYQLRDYRAQITKLFDDINVIVVPTAGTVYRITEVEDDPITLNANMGYYTNFVNLLDLAAIAVPNGFLSDGSPMGITIVGPAFSDTYLAGLASTFHGRRGIQPGAADATILPSSDQEAVR